MRTATERDWEARTDCSVHARVSAHGSEANGQDTTLGFATPLLAQSPMAPSKLFPIHKWAPSAGRTVDYFRWEEDVQELAKAFGIEPEDLNNELPL